MLCSLSRCFSKFLEASEMPAQVLENSRRETGLNHIFTKHCSGQTFEPCRHLTSGCCRPGLTRQHCMGNVTRIRTLLVADSRSSVRATWWMRQRVCCCAQTRIIEYIIFFAVSSLAVCDALLNFPQTTPYPIRNPISPVVSIVDAACTGGMRIHEKGSVPSSLTSSVT